MNRKALMQITLIAAAMVAVSIPVVARILGSSESHSSPAAVPPRVEARTDSSPASKPSSRPALSNASLADATPRPPAVESTPGGAPAPPAVEPAAQSRPAATEAATLSAIAPPEPAPAVSAGHPATPPSAVVIRDAAGRAVDPQSVIIRVGSASVTAADFDAFISDLPAREQSMARADGRRELADYLVKMSLLAQEARVRGLDQTPAVRRQTEMLSNQVLAQALINQTRDIDDDTVRNYFDQHKAQLERVQARHVLIRTPGSRVPLRPGQIELTEAQAKARADDIYKRLKAGGDFGTIARNESDDTGSGADGGDLGSFGHGKMVQAFEQTAFALNEGEISLPVRSDFGWHVIQVEHKFDTPQKLAEQIRSVIGEQRRSELVEGLKKSHKPELDEAFFGPASPAEPGQPSLTQPAVSHP